MNTVYCLGLRVCPRIFTKYLFGIPYKINYSLLFATNKREHPFLSEVKVEFSAASEKIYWNDCVGKSVAFNLLFCFVNLL